jgi:hypothetical protein
VCVVVRIEKYRLGKEGRRRRRRRRRKPLHASN